MNVRIELEKQIEHLQNELDREKDMNIQKGKAQEIEYRKKMEENEALIKEMAKIKKINIEMSNQIKNLKYKNITLSQTVERFKVSKKNKLAELSGKNKDEINNNKDEDKINENINQNISQTIANNQSNLLFPSTYSVQNSNIGSGILMPNNSSISTLPSDALPIINTSQPHISGGTLRNMKNRICKPWDKKVLTQEKLLKFSEMKKIIEGKNDMIQRLITENDFLKKNFGITNKNKSLNK